MSSRRLPLVVGNCKMNGLADALDQISLIAAELHDLGKDIGAVVCPPATLLSAATTLASNTPLSMGAQDCSVESQGAFTGDISAAMLADAGARYVILGHSERRQGRHETGRDISRKTEHVLSSGMWAIVCIGETESQMLDGLTEPVLQEQLSSSLPEGVDCQRIVIAYEPVWAIGTGRTPGLKRIGQIHAFIRQSLTEKLGDAANAVRILYGGSVKADNARDISAIPNVDGALVGGASLKAQDFLAIMRSYDPDANSAFA